MRRHREDNFWYKNKTRNCNYQVVTSTFIPLNFYHSQFIESNHMEMINKIQLLMRSNKTPASALSQLQFQSVILFANLGRFENSTWWKALIEIDKT